MTPRIHPRPATGNRPDIQEILDASAEFTGGAENILLTIANHPGLFRRFAGFTGKLLAGGKLPERQRELVILRTAWLCDSVYEWGQHHRMALAAGLHEGEISRIPDGPADPGWSPEDRALLQATDELVRSHRIARSTWDAVAGNLDDRQLIELVLLIGAYVMLGGFLNSIEVEPEPGLVGFPPEAPEVTGRAMKPG